MIRIIVTGSRHLADRHLVFSSLDRIHAARTVGCVIEGGSTGADELARQWAAERQLGHMQFRAEWKRYGHAAGPIRNHKMITDGEPDLVVAFPGGKGTSDMVKQARDCGIEVWEPVLHPAPASS